MRLYNAQTIDFTTHVHGHYFSVSVTMKRHSDFNTVRHDLTRLQCLTCVRLWCLGPAGCWPAAGWGPSSQLESDCAP